MEKTKAKTERKFKNHWHICIPIGKALQLLKKGKNIFNTDIKTAQKTLEEAQEKGQIYFIGPSCDKQNAKGQCLGHE